jgi:hypothetical protein
MLYGCAIAVFVWAAVWVVIRTICNTAINHARDMIVDGRRAEGSGALEEATAARQAIFRWFMPSFVILCCVMVVIVGTTAWVVGPAEIPAGQLEEQPAEPGRLYTGENSPEIRGPEIREEGRNIQDDSMEDLDEFRENFFNRRDGANETDSPD